MSIQIGLGTGTSTAKSVEFRRRVYGSHPRRYRTIVAFRGWHGNLLDAIIGSRVFG